MEQLDRNAPPVSFAGKLRQYRLTRHLTQEELAHAAGLSVRAVRNAELGRVRCPRRDSLKRLADALALQPDEYEQLAEAARADRVLPTTDPTETVYLAPGTGITLVLQHASVDSHSTVQIGATPARRHGQPAILLTLNQRAGNIS
jgi:transcriptional regulator with XRE-family HTH domain